MKVKRLRRLVQYLKGGGAGWSSVNCFSLQPRKKNKDLHQATPGWPSAAAPRCVSPPRLMVASQLRAMASHSTSWKCVEVKHRAEFCSGSLLALSGSAVTLINQLEERNRAVLHDPAGSRPPPRGPRRLAALGLQTRVWNVTLCTASHYLTSSSVLTRQDFGSGLSREPPPAPQSWCGSRSRCWNM